MNYFQEKTSLKAIIINIRSIRDFKKKILLVSLLRKNEIDIAFLQETFLTEDSGLYINGYKIDRADGMTHRKGVPILINKDLDIQAMKVASDAYGRFVKIRIKDNITGDKLSLASVYIEPVRENEYETLIPVTIRESNIITGDLNDTNTQLEKVGVFHYKKTYLFTFPSQMVYILYLNYYLKLGIFFKTITRIKGLK